MSKTSARLVLVRHAQHVTTVDDGGLTSIGEQQASALVDALGLQTADVVVSSPLRRARATAEALTGTCEVVAGLEEFDFGPDVPETAEMVAERTDVTLWRPEHGFEGGESLGAFHARVSETLTALVAANLGCRVVAFTHAGVIDAALRWAYGLSADDDWVTEASLPNASLTEIEHWPAGRRPGGSPWFTLVHRIGDVSHLAPDQVTDI
jgi:broad specificity phosphatase PhoE